MHVRKKAIIVIGSFIVSGTFLMIEMDYQKHQRPMTYSELTLEQKGEYYRISSLISDMQRASDQEDNERFISYKTKGEFKSNKKPLILNNEYRSLTIELKKITNPPSLKTEGFGYSVYKFLGVIS